MLKTKPNEIEILNHPQAPCEAPETAEALRRGLWQAWLRSLLLFCAPAQDRPADHGCTSCCRAGAVCRGAADVPRHLRQLHAHQSGEHGRERHHQFRLADPVQHRQEHRSHPSAAGAADRDDPLPCSAQAPGADRAAQVEAGAGDAGHPADAAAGHHGHYVRRAGQVVLRLQDLHQREHLYRQQL